MRLTRDTAGTFPNAQDNIQRDMTTIQRAIDDLQAQLTLINGRVTTVEGKVVLAGPTIQPNGTVITRSQRNGTPQVLLGSTPQPSIAPILIQKNFPVSGGLSQFYSRNTSPLEIAPATLGVTHVPLFAALWSQITPPGPPGTNQTPVTNGGASWEVTWGGTYGTLQLMNLTNLALQTLVANPASNRAFSSQNMAFATNNVANTLFKGIGFALNFMSSANMSGGTFTSMGGTCLYFDTADNLY